MAFTGQTRAQKASSQWWHMAGEETVSVLVTIRRGCDCNPTTLCASEQAAMHVPQPMQQLACEMTKRFIPALPNMPDAAYPQSLHDREILSGHLYSMSFPDMVIQIDTVE